MARPFLSRLANAVGDTTKSQVSVAVAGLDSNAPITSGTISDPVTFSAGGTQRIPHRLQRTPRGYIVINSTDYASVRFVSSDTRAIVLQSENVNTITFWVF